ncbi:uncharacterized protein UTRI_05944 [Ustilago trichophora]|uniref:Uncharacterized protein n=1 Tax=Ustilago trichophora TaxID=86804 RepID=A0A5C3EJ67_9BASI|nr:uncharacterized protein UTRI_05944 [Ustilago trichophora]
MSRRLLSYSDISELPPPPSAYPSATLSQDRRGGGSSTSYADGKRKRQAEYSGKAKKWKGKAKKGKIGGAGDTGQGIVVHWDDPSYSADVWVGADVDERNEEEGGYRSYAKQLDEMVEERIGEDNDLDGEENEEEDESESENEGETFYDATDAPETSNAIIQPSNTAKTILDRQSQHNQISYKQWKYDENAEPYDRSHRHASNSHDLGDEEEGHSYSDLKLEHEYDHGEEYDEEEYDDDEEGEEEEEEEMLPFAIPDVVEFHRSWDARHTLNPTSALTNISTSSTSDPTRIPVLDKDSSIPDATSISTLAEPHHRPPPEVGGGGRILHHTEIWGDFALIQSYSAALDQYVSMHSSTPHSLTSASPTVKDEKVKSALWYDAPRYNSLLAEQVKADTLQILALQRQSQSAHPHSSQANSFLLIQDNAKTTGMQPKGKNKDNMANRRGKPVINIVPHGHLDGNSAWKKAVKMVESTPNSIGLQTSNLDAANEGQVLVQRNDGSSSKKEKEKEKEQEKNDEQQEKLFYNWWYSGYLAGLNSASSIITETNQIHNQNQHKDKQKNESNYSTS